MNQHSFRVPTARVKFPKLCSECGELMKRGSLSKLDVASRAWVHAGCLQRIIERRQAS